MKKNLLIKLLHVLQFVSFLFLVFWRWTSSRFTFQSIALRQKLKHSVNASVRSHFVLWMSSRHSRHVTAVASLGFSQRLRGWNEVGGDLGQSRIFAAGSLHTVSEGNREDFFLEIFVELLAQLKRDVPTVGMCDDGDRLGVGRLDDFLPDGDCVVFRWLAARDGFSVSRVVVAIRDDHFVSISFRSLYVRKDGAGVQRVVDD